MQIPDVTIATVGCEKVIEQELAAMTPVQEYLFHRSQGQNLPGFGTLVQWLNIDGTARIECDSVSAGRPDRVPSVGKFRCDSVLRPAGVVDPNIEATIRIRAIGGHSLPVRGNARVSNYCLRLTDGSQHPALSVDPNQPVFL